MKRLELDLQLFAEGGMMGSTTGTAETGETATDAASQNGGANRTLNGQNGVQEAPQTQTETVAEADRSAAFDRLIRGEYKDLYNAKIQDVIKRRLKGTEETVNRYHALEPTLEMLAKKYGVKASDIEGLNKAIQEDDAYYEDEAMERGISVEQLKELKRMERENAELKKQMDESARREFANRQYARWFEQAEAMKSVYPAFDLRQEMENTDFAKLISNNIDVRTAYEVIHKDEIFPAVVHAAARDVKEKLVNNIMAGNARPAENGVSAKSPAIVKSDVSKLSKAERQEIIRRVQRGEKITF